MTTVKKQGVRKAIPIAWQPTEVETKSFNSDAVIDAYLKGREDGFAHEVSEMERLAVQILKDNATKAAFSTNAVLAFLKENKLAAVDAYLKVSSWDELSVMVLVKHTSFLKPSFKQVYNLVSELETASEQENLALYFTFAPYSKDFNISCLNADGYALRLKQQEKQTGVTAE
ncbi:hypothetical protein ACFPAF_01730 [Hymenobacter endophyticus]|uniref:Uncharacterized protein n=1 Tax=Hymenobacter endophyticus TaxID=3076335 RepID=A0ABU3TCK5_9BACT|nr:hypothetical protein [Hymenobacter endophyticus]MDU0369098.1 hypothetical protein [Hymenobacter endophyticus]